MKSLRLFVPEIGLRTTTAKKHYFILLVAILSLVVLWPNRVDARGSDEESVRLVDGRDSSEGRVEIRVNGTWGTICDPNFSLYDAQVICRVLGYDRAERVNQSNGFGAGEHPPMFALECTGVEESVLDCLTINSSCGPAASAGVKCFHGTATPYPKGVFVEAIASLVCAVTAVIVTCVIAVIGFLLYRCKRRRSHEQYIAPCQLQQPLVSKNAEVHLAVELAPNGPDTSPPVATPAVAPDISHEAALKRLCYVPFGIHTITVAPRIGGLITLMPPVQGVAEDTGDTIQVEVSTGDGPFSLHHAVLVEGPFQLPEGYRLASDVVYLYSDPLEPVRPFILRLPHWYSQEEGAEAGITKRDDLVFVTAPHTPSQEGKEEQYKFVLQQEGNFPTSGVGLLQVNSHSTLFGIAFKEDITSKLKYCATHLEREEPSGQKVDIAVTFASLTWQEILEQHHGKEAVRGKPVKFNFQSSQIIGKVEQDTGRKWRAALHGSAQIDEEEITYHSNGMRNAEDLKSAVKMGMYPPSLSFTVVYDTALKSSKYGQPSMVSLFCEGTTGGRLQFNSVVYEEKEEARGAQNLPTQGNDGAPAPSMILLQDYIPQLSDKWAELGTALGLEHQVRTLQNSNQPPERCMYSLLKDWVDAGDRVVSGKQVKVSWIFLVQALRSPVVGKGSIATTIEKSYIQEN